MSASWHPSGLAHQAAGSHSQGRLPLGCPYCLAFVLTLHITLDLWQPKEQENTLGTTEDASLHAFSRNSSGGQPLWARQKSPAAPATARVAWWTVRGSKAKIQLLQLLWLNHLLNYTGKCAWNHNLQSWFSSTRSETRVNWARVNHSSFIANFAYLHQPYQDTWTLGDWEPKDFSETKTTTTTMFLKPHRWVFS